MFNKCFWLGHTKPSRQTIAKAINVRRTARKAKRKVWEQQDKGE